MIARRRRRRGFTLLELLLTLAVTTIGLVGLMSLHLSIARGNDSAARFAEATQIGNATLESLRAQSLPDMMKTLTGNPAAVPPTDVNLSTMAGRGGMTYTRRVLVTVLNSASTSLWKIRVEVRWAEDGAAVGSAGDPLSHTVAIELIRTVEESL